MDVVEICPGAETDPAVIERLIAITEALGKAPAVLRWPVPGYLLNRLQYALMREAWNLVESGVCDFADVDRALTHGLGLRWAAIGPFEVQDIAGLDVHLAVASSLMPVLERPARAAGGAAADGGGGRPRHVDGARSARRLRRGENGRADSPPGAGHASGESRPLSGSRGAAAPSCAGRVCDRPSPGCGWCHRP